jgi:hypothetical protein
VEGIALQATTRIPVDRGLVAIEIAAAPIGILLLTPDHDPVSDEGSKAAHMRVIRATDPREAPVIAVLVSIDPFPATIGIHTEGILNIDGLEERQGERIRCDQGSRAGHGSLQEGPTGYFHESSPFLRDPILAILIRVGMVDEK